MSIKVLIVSYSFPPSNAPAAQRPYSFAKYLPNFGITPLVLTTLNNLSSLGYGTSMDASKMTIIDTSESLYKEQGIKEKSAPPKATSKNIISAGFIKKIAIQLLIPDRGIIWLPKAMKYGAQALKSQKDISCIYATGPSFANLIIAALLAKRFNKKLICDFRDFYATNGIFKRSFPLFYIDRWIEKWVFRNSNYITFISNSMRSIYVDAHPSIKNKTEVIYNGFDDDDFPVATIPSEKVIEKKVKVFYAGSLYYDSAHRRDVFLLLDSIKVLMEKGLVDLAKIEIKIAAFIPQELLEKLKVHPVFPALNLLGVISRDQVLKEMQLSNLLWHIMFNSYQDRASIPIKTYEYMASRKKVLFFLPQNSELEEIVKEFDLGYIGYSSSEFATTNQKSFLNAYNDVLNNTIQDESLHPRDLSRFKRKYQAGQLAHLIEKLTV